MNALPIVTHGLGHSFGTLRAVRDVNIEVEQGAVFGLLGPDGAGKSTLIRMLATVLLPTTGDAEIFGQSVVRHAGRVTPRIGYMSQRFCMYPDLTIAENVEFFATLRGVSRADRRVRSRRLLEGMGLAEFAKRQAGRLSGGMKQKLMLAATLMHQPDLLLLDEPTTGVDPVSRREFWRILAGLQREGKTVLVATPYMDEAERCTSIAFMDGGRIVRAGTPDEIRASVHGTLLEVATPQPREALAVATGAQGVASAHLYGDRLRVLMSGGAVGADLLHATLWDAGVEVDSVHPVNVDMEAAFAFLAEQGSGAGAPA